MCQQPIDIPTYSYITSALPSNLVPQLLTGEDGDFLTYPLVGVEIKSETCVVFLNDDLGGLLDGLGSNTTLELQSNHK